MFSKRPIKVPKPPHLRGRFSSLLILLIFLMVISVVFLSSLNDARKPAIYLYPVEDMTIKVEVDVNGFMHDDIPEYGNGWEVFVTREGIIENTYDYLFYEALLWRVDLPDRGWVIPYADLKTWLESKLPELGLNEKESEQFLEYWLAELPVANYYEIKLLEDGYLAKNMQLSILPQPDTKIRLLFHFKPLEEKRQLIEPVIITPERKGFTVVEWGGILND